MNPQNFNFLKHARKKGWTLKSLGVRWCLSERQMSRLTSTQEVRYMDAINGLPKRIELKINKHPSGRLTLMEKKPKGKIFSDCKDNGLFGNLNEEEFYKYVSLYISTLEKKGMIVDVKKCDWLLIPPPRIFAFDVIIHWIKKWARNDIEDKELKNKGELAITESFENLGLIFNEKQFGSFSFDNCQFLYGSDGVAISEHYFIFIPKNIKRICQ